MRVSQLGLALLTVAMLAGLAACDGEGDLRAWVAEVKARKGAPLPPLPVVKTFETFLYQDQDKRDPFLPGPMVVAVGGDLAGPHPDQNRPREPLEAFQLDTLKMVGTIGTGGNVEALIKDPQGVIYQVHVGNYMGQNFGRVTKVTPSQVDLVELVPNGAGGWMERDSTVALGEN